MNALIYKNTQYIMNPQSYLSFALTTMQQARSFILERSQADFKISTKADTTLVTEVDRETEKLIRAEIEKNFPDHSVVGEELGVTNEGSDFVWYLDPIDGTLSFSHGIPLYGSILALYYGGQPLVGIIDHPGIGICYHAARGMGSFCNGQKITIHDVKSRDDLKKEIIATGDKREFEDPGVIDAYKSLLEQHDLVRTIPDCFGHTLAAKGAVGAMIDLDLNIWDIAATKIIVEEAGGKFVSFEKVKQVDEKQKYNIICGKPQVVDWVETIFQSSL